ncbi:MAG: Asp23/Gls24 family envelope stress response protein [Clostridia bacterium]|nr:Asp23/Gls24 family envelope stress response protein [Clostridia bacterium]
MDDKRYTTPEGRCIISEEVIATIAGTAALEVPGVAGLASRLPDIRNLVTANGSKAVGVINNENETIVDVYVNLKAGMRIPDVAGAVQRQVKTAVQSMTGKPVTKINVHVVGIVLDEKEPAAKTAED